MLNVVAACAPLTASRAYPIVSSPMAAYRLVVAATAAAGCIVHHIWKNLPV